MPFFAAAHRLPAEDALALDDDSDKRERAVMRIVVLAYPRIANFDDFDPLRLEPGVDLQSPSRPGEPMPGDAALVILPGSKATIADLAALRDSRLGHRPRGACAARRPRARHLRRLSDARPHASPIRTASRVRRRRSTGLGLLDVETVLDGDKVLVEVARRDVPDGVPFKGYEMHVGRTTGAAASTPCCALDGRSDGAVSATAGSPAATSTACFADDRQRQHWLEKLGGERRRLDYEADVDATLDPLGRSPREASRLRRAACARRCRCSQRDEAQHSSRQQRRPACRKPRDRARAPRGCLRGRFATRPSPIQRSSTTSPP